MTSTTEERPAEKGSVAGEEAKRQGVPGEGPGRLLKERREQIGITPMEAASRMNINVQQLYAMEANDFANLPAPIFVRNFLTRYGELLELDAQELIRMYETAGELNQPKLSRVSIRQSINSSNVSVRWVTYALIGLVLALVLIWATSMGVGNLWQKVSTEAEAPGEPAVNEISLPELPPEGAGNEEFAEQPEGQQ